MGLKILMKMPAVLKTKWALAVYAFILGAAVILGIRFITYHPNKVHYNANFADYINGQKEEFKNPIYYIAIAAMCSTNAAKTPTDRAHMHSGVNNVVHVEDSAVTWGQFFQNIGWVVDPRVIRNMDGLFMPDEQNKITFILNGKKVDGAMRLVINDQDKLLVDYGTTSDGQLQKEYRAIPATARKYDTAPDPKSCSGSKPITIKERLEHLF
jgi:hypothetical protein